MRIFGWGSATDRLRPRCVGADSTFVAGPIPRRIWLIEGPRIGADAESMSVNLSIKNAPERIVDKLRKRAERHQRSLQGELLAIIEEAVRDDRSLTPAELLAEVRRLGLHTPAESVAIVRADRDGR